VNRTTWPGPIESLGVWNSYVSVTLGKEEDLRNVKAKRCWALTRWEISVNTAWRNTPNMALKRRRALAAIAFAILMVW